VKKMKKIEQLKHSNKSERANNANTNNYIKVIALGATAVGISLLGAEVANAAARFDLNAGVNAAATPLIQGVRDHWAKVVFLSGAATATIGEGDPRQRAQRAVVGCVAGGAVILGLIAMLG
jgi:hypothetical protein